MPTYQEAPPDPAHADVLLCQWTFTGPRERSLRHCIPPDGCANLVWTPDGLLVMGPRTRPLYVDLPPGHRGRGWRLRPEAIRAVLGCGGRDLRDRLVPMSDVVFGATTVDGDGLPTRPDFARIDARVKAAAACVVQHQGNVSMAEVAEAAGASQRHLERRFGDDVGLSVKAFARIIRFRYALAGRLFGHLPSWARAAYDAGYADQSHLVREAVALTGLAPHALHRYLASIDHHGIG